MRYQSGPAISATVTESPSYRSTFSSTRPEEDVVQADGLAIAVRAQHQHVGGVGALVEAAGQRKGGQEARGLGHREGAGLLTLPRTAIWRGELRHAHDDFGVDEELGVGLADLVGEELGNREAARPNLTEQGQGDLAIGADGLLLDLELLRCRSRRRSASRRRRAHSSSAARAGRSPAAPGPAGSARRARSWAIASGPGIRRAIASTQQRAAWKGRNRIAGMGVLRIEQGSVRSF